MQTQNINSKTEYQTHLDTFEGPLDLLLYLIKKNDLDINQIQIAQITSQYLEYLQLMKDLNLEIAGEFIVMASTLMQIKARSLLPSKAGEDLQEEEDEDLAKLKERLSQYQQYKEIGKLLSYKEMENSQVYYRPALAQDKSDFILDAAIFDLVEGFKAALEALPKEAMSVISDQIPIETKIREILDILEGKNFVSFTDILKLQKTKMALIVSFMAVLELIKDRLIAAKQSALFDEIRIYKLEYKAQDDNILEAGDLELSAPSGDENGQ
ncbi:MAG: segregation/condensation protein A [Elusimicrobiota bacterium]|jgi:segregation and condensation protein A|nr:segregation/condensation protein A [Elusimicrobiota bacterium]